MNENNQDKRNIQNYFYGAIQNYICGDYHAHAPIHNTMGQSTPQQANYSDTQVATALSHIVGRGKPIDSKQKWAGAQWLLRWLNNYPAKAQDFCEKIDSLPFEDELEIKCDYNNIRPFTTLSFMNEDARKLDSVKYSKADETAFFMLRSVVVALDQELKKTAIPKGGF